MQAQAKRTGDFQHRREIGAPLARESLVQALARQARRASDARHALRARDVAERLRDERGITVALLDRSVEIERHLLGRSQMLCDVVTLCLCLGHGAPHKFFANAIARAMSSRCVDLLPSARSTI